MGSRIDLIEVNSILQQLFSYYIPFFNQSFPCSLRPVLVFLTTRREKQTLFETHTFHILSRLTKSLDLNKN